MPRVSVSGLLSVAIIAAFAVGALAGFTILVVHDPVPDLVERLPGEDDRPAGLPPARTVLFDKFFRKGSGTPSAITASWPGFRGPNRDNVSRESVPLATPGPDWTADRILWEKTDLGEGYAGAAVANGRVYVLDYDEIRQADALRCLSLDTGEEIWRRWYVLGLKPNHGYSRTVPAVSGRYVVTIGPNCQLMCCDALDGAFRWGKNLLEEEFGVEDQMATWYTGQCPLIDGSRAVIAVGGPQILMMGVDLATGNIAWRTPNRRKLTISHSSILLATIGGVRTYVYAALGGIVGVSAEPASRGTLLWEYTDFDAPVIMPSPVAVGEDMVFVTSAYQASGSVMLRVSREGSRFVARELYRCSQEDGFTSYQQTPILFEGMLIGILPYVGTRRGELACWDPVARRFVWTSGKENRFISWGPYLIADGKIVILNQNGELSMAEATLGGFRRLGGSTKILDGPEAWAPMALVAGRLIARDAHRMVCIDLRKRD